jgi:hypothetical protein
VTIETKKAEQDKSYDAAPNNDFFIHFDFPGLILENKEGIPVPCLLLMQRNTAVKSPPADRALLFRLSVTVALHCMQQSITILRETAFVIHFSILQYNLHNASL